MVKKNEALCFYCGNIIDRISSRRKDYCSDKCRIKYYRGISKKLWKTGDLVVMPSDKPNVKDMKGGIYKK